MSTGKRLAKRSIVGTKVVVLREDGLYYPGTIRVSFFHSIFGGQLLGLLWFYVLYTLQA